MYINPSYQSPIVYHGRPFYNQQQVLSPQPSNIITKQYNPYYQSPMTGYSHYPVGPVSGEDNMYPTKDPRNSFKANRTSNNLNTYDPTIDQIVNKYRNRSHDFDQLAPLQRQYTSQTMNSVISKDSPMKKINFQDYSKKNEENIHWQRNSYLQQEEEKDQFRNFDEQDNNFNDFPAVQSFKPSALQDQIFPSTSLTSPLDDKFINQSNIQQLHKQENQVDKMISDKLTSKVESVLKTPKIESQINKLNVVTNDKKLVSLGLKVLCAILILLLIYELFQ